MRELSADSIEFTIVLPDGPRVHGSREALPALVEVISRLRVRFVQERRPSQPVRAVPPKLAPQGPTSPRSEQPAARVPHAPVATSASDKKLPSAAAGSRDLADAETTSQQLARPSHGATQSPERPLVLMGKAAEERIRELQQARAADEARVRAGGSRKRPTNSRSTPSKKSTKPTTAKPEKPTAKKTRATRR